MNRRTMALLCCSALLGAIACGTAFADPGTTEISKFLDPGSLFRKASLPALKTGEGLRPILQESGSEWGWGGGIKESEEGAEGAEKEKPEKKETETLEPLDEKPRGWQEKPAKREEGTEPAPIPAEPYDLEEREEIWAKRTRIGLELGGFLPFGAKEEAFGTGQIAGVFLGFGLPTLVKGITITMEIRILEGYTTSPDQLGGVYDVTTLMFMVKDDLLFHFFPRQKSFNLFYFLGVSLGYEMTSAKKATPSGGSESDSGAAVWFLIDTGFGSWVNLGGPVDLLLRIEFNIVPVTKNVPFFVVGEIGVQVKF